MTITQFITALPAVPDPAVDSAEEFSTKAAAFVLAQKGMSTELGVAIPQINATALQMNVDAANSDASADAAAVSQASAAASAASAIASPGTNATSTTSLSVGSGSKSMTVQTGKSFAPGMWMNCVRTADRTQRMLGYIDSYNSGTGTLTLVVAAADINGAGTYTDWTLTPSSIRGSIFNAVDLTMLGPSIRPSLLCDFANSKSLDSRFTYTMTSPLTYFDALGIMRAAAAGQICFNHDPATGRCLGVPMWEARTNSVRNNTMQGTIVGAPGTPPANWSIGVPTGCTKEITSVGTWDGIEYIRVRCSGTVTGASGQLFYIFPESNAGPAAVGQTWTHWAFAQIYAGSLANTNLQIGLDEMTSGGGFLTGGSIPIAVASGGSINAQKFSHTRTLNQATVGALRGAIYTVIAVGASVDFTITVGVPQIEQGAFATPSIKTTTAAVTRAAPTLSMPTSAFDFNASEGTLYAESDYAQIAANNPTMARVDDGSENNRMMLRIAGGTQRFSCVAANTENVDIPLGAPSVGVPAKVVGAYKANDFAATKDGGTTGTDTSATVPVVTTLRLGQDGSAFNYVNGHISKFAYFPKRLSAAELVALTTQ